MSGVDNLSHNYFVDNEIQRIISIRILFGKRPFYSKGGVANPELYGFGMRDAFYEIIEIFRVGNL